MTYINMPSGLKAVHSLGSGFSRKSQQHRLNCHPHHPLNCVLEVHATTPIAIPTVMFALLAERARVVKLVIAEKQQRITRRMIALALALAFALAAGRRPWEEGADESIALRGHVGRRSATNKNENASKQLDHAQYHSHEVVSRLQQKA